MRTLVVFLVLNVWSALAIADHVKYEFGSYRDKVSLSFSDGMLQLTRFTGERVDVLCRKEISKDTLSHSLEVFFELGIDKWSETYFVEHMKDGIGFGIDIQIENFKKSSIGHIELAPKEHKELVRYLNQLLVVNGCDKAI